MAFGLLDAAALHLFVPADQPGRFAKACTAGTDAVIVDLEDAVAQEAKHEARLALAAMNDDLASASCLVIVRINAGGSADHAEDLALVGRLSIAGVMLAKTESPNDVSHVSDATGHPVIALIETARGLARARDIAAVARLAFGSIDFAADLGCAHTRDALLAARSELVLASRLAGRSPPLDGVTTSLKEAHLVEDDTRYAVSIGMGGKLLVHPLQIEPARRGLLATDEETRWAERILATSDKGATTLDGAMVDAPVRLRAKQILDRQARPGS